MDIQYQKDTSDNLHSKANYKTKLFFDLNK